MPLKPDALAILEVEPDIVMKGLMVPLQAKHVVCAPLSMIVLAISF
jgi:hypothetical protein